jgi:acyl-CoA reductase-like NAD-dependent aldehyde dehydrogenase
MKNKENIVINKIQAAENVTDNTSKKLKEKQHSAGRLQRVSLTEKRFLDDAVHAAARVKGKKLTAEERRKVLCVAREQIRSQRKAEQIKNERNKERFEAEFEWKKPVSFRR